MKRKQEDRKANLLSRKALFGSIVFGITTFGRDEHKRSIKIFRPKNINQLLISDITLFELSCYAMMRIEQWLDRKASQEVDQTETPLDLQKTDEEITDLVDEIYSKWEKLGKSIHYEFIELYTDIFQSNQIKDIFQARFEEYRRMVVALEITDTEQYHKAISTLSRMSNQYLPVSQFNYEKLPVMLGSALEDMGFRAEMTGWEIHMMPAILNTIEKASHFLM